MSMKPSKDSYYSLESI